MTKKFQFQFIHKDNKNSTNYFFDFIGSDEDIKKKYNDGMFLGTRYDLVLYDMEEYGTHVKFSNETVIHGFKSTDVNSARYKTVIKHWKRFFSDVIGLESGPIYSTEEHLEL